MANTVRISKDVPVVADVDVIVAGSGIAGSIAALAAARNGARTLLIDRFGCLGGNMGPGMFSGGVLHLCLHQPEAMHEGLKGIPGEFINRAEGYGGGQLGHDYFKDSQAVSYVLFRMMEESNVELMLNTFVADPILDGDRVVGLTMENKSGTQAVTAKVVIDATGDADVAARAGVPTDPGARYNHPGMYFAIGGVEEERYRAFLDDAPEPDPEDVKWAETLFKEEFGAPWHVKSFNPMLPSIRRAWQVGEYRVIQRIAGLAVIYVDHGFYAPQRGIVGAQVGLWGEEIDSGNAAQNTALERGTRVYIFETADFMRRHVPGFENSYLHIMSPYFHSRGGRSAMCDYNVTEDDVNNGARFDDVAFVGYGHERQTSPPDGYDFPYRQFLPREIEGLMVTGRSAIIQPPTMRARWIMLMMGQAGGVAAALAVQQGVPPRALDVKALQHLLHQRYHVPYGGDSRLAELGLIQA